MGLLRRCASTRSGPRPNRFLLVFKSYIRPVLEFGCTVFSGLPNYRIACLLVLERRSLRFCIGLPRYVANNVLYCESRTPCLQSRYRYLTLCSYMRFYHAPWCVRKVIIFIVRLESLSHPGCSRSRPAQLNVPKSLPISIDSSLDRLYQPVSCNHDNPRVPVSVVDIIDKCERYL